MSSSLSRPPALKLYGLIALMTFLWAMNFVISKIALREIPALLTAGLRTALAGLLILPIYFLRAKNGNGRDWKLRELPLLLYLGLFGVALNQLFFVLGISRTSVAHAAFMIGLTPILVLLLAAAARLERVTALKLCGMATAAAGVVLLQAKREQSSGATLSGDMFILLAALTFALFTVIGKRAAGGFSSLTVNTFAYAGGGLMLLPITITQSLKFSFAAVSAVAWASVVYMALFPSIVCYLIYYYALRHVPASRISAFSYVQPLLATVMAIPLLGERPTASLLAGGALVVTGVWITERG